MTNKAGEDNISLNAGRGGIDINKRVWEIDLLRVLAILLMVVFHLVYDLNEFMGINIVYTRGFWYWVGKAAALIFIFISGISSGFSRNNVKRGLWLLALGGVITAVTYFFLGNQYIRYGILHFLGTCMILYPLLRKLNVWLLAALALAICWASNFVGDMFISSGWLLPLGIRYLGFRSADYYPLVPYLAVFILGIIAYKLYYHRRRSLFRFQLKSRLVSTLSRNSLLIYLAHQPLFIGVIMILQAVLD